MDLPPPPSLESDTPNSPGQVFRNSPKTPKKKTGNPTKFPLPPHSTEMPSNFLAELKRTKKVQVLNTTYALKISEWLIKIYISTLNS